MQYLKTCIQCSKDFLVKNSPLSKVNISRKFCSYPCFVSSRKGKKRDKIIGLKISASKIKNNYHPSDEVKNRISNSRKGKCTGSLNGNWKNDRTKFKREDRRNDCAYYEWRRVVYQRDKWKCSLSNQECEGRIEAHHILAWKDYPGLRYDINNGITVCRFHHPRKREDVNNSIKHFQKLLINKSL